MTKKSERLEVKLSGDDKRKVEFLVKKSKTDKSKLIRNLINNAYDFVKSVTHEKN